MDSGPAPDGASRNDGVWKSLTLTAHRPFGHSGAREARSLDVQLHIRESITTLSVDGQVRLHSGKQETRYALSRRNQQYRSGVYEHRSKAIGGFTTRYGVDKLVWFETYADAITAISREKELKKWRRDRKIRLIEEQNPEWSDLYPGICN
jgi:putative endonuclease